jgi:hypothetical protein
VDNTDAEKQTGQRCFVCMRVKITNNIYTVQIFYDFEKEKKNSNFCSVFFFKEKSPTIVVPHLLVLVYLHMGSYLVENSSKRM